MKSLKYSNPIIIDTDIGDDIDDTWTLMLMLASKAFDIKMIVLTNFDTEYKLKLTAKMLELTSNTHIPIVVMPSSNIPPGYKRGQQRYVESYDIKNYKGIIIRNEALEFVKDEIINSPERVVLFELAPNTTLAALIEKYPYICENCYVYAMAGAVNRSYETLDRVVAEFNIACDYEASRKVLNSSLEYTMLPLDVCAKIRLKNGLYQRFLKSGSVYAQIIRENYKIWVDDAFFEQSNDYGTASSILFDFVVPFYALFPENFIMRRDNFYLNSENITKIGEGKSILWASEVVNMDKMLEWATDIF